ncbi:MAG: AEC family transporter [Pygmaiobacter massiliensis]|nr:AEC family transporter [Pygmaiobacter massiliensis]
MDSFLYSVNSTIPIFGVMVLGWWLRRIGLIGDTFVQQGNKLVFQVALPVSLFCSVYTTDFSVFANAKLVTYCICACLGAFALCWLLAILFVSPASSRGSFVQAASRGNVAILGLPFIQSMYNGETGAMPLVMAISVTIYNVVSVLLLSFYDSEKNRSDAGTFLRQSLVGVAKNPLIRGLALGFIASLCHLQLPVLLDKTLTSVASLSTPLALVVLGAGFDFAKARGKLGLTLGCTFLKLIGLPAVCIPIAVALGFRGITLSSLLIMSGASCAVSSYIMAKNMHNDEVLASSAVAATTLASSFTLTFWIFLLRVLGLI